MYVTTEMIDKNGGLNMRRKNKWFITLIAIILLPITIPIYLIVFVFTSLFGRNEPSDYDGGMEP